MAVEIRVPALGESIVEATVGKWLKREGDRVAAGETLVELETDKVNVEVTAEQDGVLERIVKAEGETVGIGEVLATLGDGAASGRAADGAGAQAPAPAAPGGRRAAKGASGARRRRRPRRPDGDPPWRAVWPPSRGSIFERVQGSGPGGRITKDDVAQIVSGPPSASSPPPQQSSSNATSYQSATARNGQRAPNHRTPRGEERMRMSRRRQTIAAAPGRGAAHRRDADDLQRDRHDAR